MSVKLILKNITVKNNQTKETANDFAKKRQIKLIFICFLMEWKDIDYLIVTKHRKY